MTLNEYIKNNNREGKPKLYIKIKNSLMSFLVALTLIIGVPNQLEGLTILMKDNISQKKYTVDEDGLVNPIVIYFNSDKDSKNMLEGSSVIKTDKDK